MSRRRALAVVPLAVLVAALVGCTESARIPPPEPSSATPPLFATDEEALEAATVAYERYLALSYGIAGEPTISLDKLEAVTTGDYLDRERAFFETLESEGWRTVGTPIIESASLQQHYVDAVDGAVVAVYLCIDVSSARVIDEGGSDVTPADREDLTGLEVEFVEGNAGELLLNRSEAWSGDSVC